jgi:predicted RNA-binding protein (virulence factor B family)
MSALTTVEQMMNVGQMNTLRIAKTVDFGVYLDGEDLGEILLPKRYLPKACEPNDLLEVFLYHDSEDRLIATTETPKARVGECAALTVIQVNRVGAFLDWGLPKDLLVPFSEQMTPMKEGKTYLVYLYIDEHSGRILGSSKLDRFFPETNVYLKADKQVNIQIFAQSDLGYKAIIDGSTIGLLFKNEVFRPIKIGDRLSAYISSIRDDGKIDLSLQRPGSHVNGRQALTQQIIDHLKANDGTSTLTDKSPPNDIYALYHVSKGSYKKALGALYKQRKITITKEAIVLI